MWPWYVKYYPIDPEDFEMWSHQAYYSYLLGAPEWGDRYLERALELGPDEPAVLKCHAFILQQQGRFNEALALAQRALDAEMSDRWFSRSAFLRMVRDDALRKGDLDSARMRYLDVYPELFEDQPVITVDNIHAAADLTMLLKQTGETEKAGRLIQAGLEWYRQNQPDHMHGYLTTIVDVSFLALNGDDEAALKALGEAVEQGWKYDWRWHMGNPNLDSIRDTPRFAELETRLERETAEQHAAVQALPDMGEFDLRSSTKSSSFTK